jgi:hypothetical protein
MDELQVMRALGMSIDLMRPVAAATRMLRPALRRTDGHTHRSL